MKKFIKHDDETILAESKASEYSIKKNVLGLIVSIAFLIIVIINIKVDVEILISMSWYSAEEVTTEILKLLAWLIPLVPIPLYSLNIISLMTIEIILTDKRLYYKEDGPLGKHEDIPIENIEHCFFGDALSLYYLEDGELIIITTEGYMMRFKDIRNAKNISKAFTELMISRATKN